MYAMFALLLSPIQYFFHRLFLWLLREAVLNKSSPNFFGKIHVATPHGRKWTRPPRVLAARCSLFTTDLLLQRSVVLICRSSETRGLFETATWRSCAATTADKCSTSSATEMSGSATSPTAPQVPV